MFATLQKRSGRVELFDFGPGLEAWKGIFFSWAIKKSLKGLLGPLVGGPEPGSGNFS